uniref:Histone-lysine N-methyltransferase n=1 Tax=Hydatigena taeniaeformis TaxID=6205 RepID=A0A0R3WII8_HYDTA
LPFIADDRCARRSIAFTIFIRSLFAFGAIYVVRCIFNVRCLHPFPEYLRPPTKHSTNVDTAPSVVPVPTVVSRPALPSTTPESMLSTTIRNSPVRLLLNSTASISDTLISVQPQFALFPSVKLSSSDQVADRSAVGNSAGAVSKKTEFDSNCGGNDTNSSHFSPITIISPTKMSSSPQIMPLVQDTELRSFARPTLSGSASFSTVPTTANAKILPIAVPADAVSHSSPNLLTTLRPAKSDSASISSLSTVQVSAAGQSLPDPIVSSASPFLKASSLVSHSTVPVVSVEANQPASLISVSKSGQSSIRPAPRVPIAVAPSRPMATGVALSRPSISRQPIIAPVSPINSSTCPLTPSRKRARKQQLLAPQGTESPSTATGTGASSAVVNIVEMVASPNDGASKSSIPKVITSPVVNSATTTISTSTPNIEAALQSTNPSPLPIVTVASSSSSGSGQVLNLRFLQVRTAANNVQAGKEVAPHLEQVAMSPATSLVAPQFHSLVVSSSSNVALDEVQPPPTSTPAQTTTASIAASLVTASSFHSGSIAPQQSMYVFPTTAVATPLRSTSTATSSVGSVVQVRFRAPTPTKPLLSNATAQQTVRTALSQSVTSNTVQGGFHLALQPASPPLRKAPSIDWSTPKPSTPAKQPLALSTTAASEECTRQVPSASINAIPKVTPMDSSGQPTVPILRVPDPNSRNCFENFSNANATMASPCKRPRKQSNNGSVIKKQCTWELRTDPMDSNKSVWRSPLECTDRLSPSCNLQDSERTGTTLKKETVSIGAADSIIHGRPVRMRMYKPLHSTSRFSGVWKGPKTGHFLRSSEIRQRSEGSQHPLFSQFRASSSMNRHPLESGLRRRRPRDPVQYEQLEVFEIGSSCKNPDFFALSELLELRNQQAEMGFVNYPVDTTSPLDLNCWRIVLCLKNCEKLIGVEYEKLSTLSRAFEGIFQKRCECCSGQRMQGGQASSVRDFIEDQQQELITRLFLQAIPPASPSTSESRAGNSEELGKCKRTDDKPMHYTKVGMDLKVIEERAMGLLQRIQALVDGLRRVSKLSRDLIAGHREPVISFVDDLEFLQQNGSARSSTPSSSRSPHHRLDEGSSNSAIGSSTSSDTDDEIEIGDVRVRTKPLGPPSSSRPALSSTSSGGRRRSVSPMVIKSSSPVRATFHNGRRR